MKTKLLLLVLHGAFLAAVAESPAQTAGQTAAPAAAAPPATPAPPPAAPAKRSAAELEKLVAPIALHPDPLISIILPASVYPLEIVQAARFVKDTNNLPNVDAQPWDVNVKALAKFPELIQKMNDDLTWTMSLGEAFLDQQKELMDTIQALRAKANAIGVLKTTPQQVIVVTNTIVQTTVQQQIVYVTNTVVQIQPSNPQIVYVPVYPPTIYYPPPVYAGPPPILTFAAGIAVGAIIANNCDWHGGGIYVGGSGVVVWGGGGYHGNNNDVNIKVDNSVNIGNNNQGGNTINNGGNKPVQRPADGQKWQPDPNRVSKSGSPSGAATARTSEARGWGAPGAKPSTGAVGAGGAGAARPSTGAVGARPSTGTPGASPSTGAVGARPSTGTPSASRPAPSTGAARPTPSAAPSARPSQSPSASPGRSPSPGAYGGVNSGASDRSASSRGASSRSGGGGGGSRGGGGGRR